jgi:hypothetical protein
MGRGDEKPPNQIRAVFFVRCVDEALAEIIGVDAGRRLRNAAENKGDRDA